MSQLEDTHVRTEGGHNNVLKTPVKQEGKAGGLLRSGVLYFETGRPARLRFFVFAQRAKAAPRAISRRRAFVSFLARFRPPMRPIIVESIALSIHAVKKNRK